MSATSAVGGTNSLSPADFASSMFKKMDTDSDGKVSKSDFETANSANGMTTEQADDLFSKIDADGDGTITESENSSFASKAPNGPPPPDQANGQAQSGTQSVDAYA